jgi:tetratricopeptide (TPR) repeat protein
MKAYEIKTWPMSDDRVWRIVEISDRQTLHQLGQLLQDEFRLHGNHLYCFYMGEKPYNAKVAYGGPHADTPRQAVKTSMGSLGLKRGRRFLYVYDFAEDRVLRLQIQRVRTVSDASGYPRVSKRNGRVPEAADSARKGRKRELGPLKALAGELGSIAEAWSQGKRPSKAALRHELELARTLDDRLQGEWEKLKLLERHTGHDVSGWLVALPEALAAEGLAAEALDVIEKFAGFEPVSFLSDKPLVLVKTGQEEEAKQEAEANTRRFPEDAWVWAKAGDLFRRLGDAGRAETLLRKALELAGNALYLRESVLERLLALLEEAGKSQAARELTEAEQRRRARSERGG